MALVSTEAGRKLIHVAMGGFAFLLRWLTWPQAAACAVAAVVFNAFVLPRVGGRRLWREGERSAGHAFGIVAYPVAVLALVLLFHDRLHVAAALWGILAFGDGMATVVGLLAGGPRLPWNPRKGWAGSIAFVVFGTLGAAVLWCWTLQLPAVAWGWVAVRCFLVALFCAWVESLETTLDDNVTVPLTGAALLPLLTLADFSRLAEPELLRQAAIGLGVNVAVAALAMKARSIDLGGAISAVVIGTAITAGTGLAGFAVMMAFFVLGSGATRMGYQLKAARGIAQEKGGARGWRNAWANGGVAAGLALLAGVASTPQAVLVLTIAYAAAVATAAADTCSSEVGKAYGRRTFLITTFRPVPPGTEGAVSLEGTLGGLVGGMIVGAVGAVCGLYGPAAAVLVGVAGLLGSLAESVIGVAAERKGWMGNDLLNALNTAIGAAIAGAFVHLAGGVR
jgi:uncharacterized protein (TIGR00297 family)